MSQSTIQATIATIQSQAARLGYSVWAEIAASGSAYLRLDHPMWCDCAGDCTVNHERLIRVSDHEANHARYQARINEEPDLFVDTGFQATAIRRLAAWIGVDPASVPYLRLEATIAAKRAGERDAEAARREAETASTKQRIAEQVARLSPEDRETWEQADRLHGKARKRFFRRGDYKRVRKLVCGY